MSGPTAGLPAVLSLGSNAGDPARHLQLGVEVLASLVEVRAVSPVYQTRPVGGPPQQDFLNAIALAGVPDPQAALRAAQAAEQAAHRTRTVRWGPRTLDVDVITVDDVRSDEQTLVLPHPRAHERAFVLVPWADVEPDAVLPGHGPVRQLLAGLGADGVLRRPDVTLTVPR